MDAVIVREYTYRLMSQSICVSHVLATSRSFSWVYQTLRVSYLMDALIVWEYTYRPMSQNHWSHIRACNQSFIFLSLSDIECVLSDGCCDCLGIHLQANESKHLCHPRACNWSFIFLSVSDIVCVLSDGCYDCLGIYLQANGSKHFCHPL